MHALPDQVVEHGRVAVPGRPERRVVSVTVRVVQVRSLGAQHAHHLQLAQTGCHVKCSLAVLWIDGVGLALTYSGCHVKCSFAVLWIDGVELALTYCGYHVKCSLAVLRIDGAGLTLTYTGRQVDCNLFISSCYGYMTLG